MRARDIRIGHTYLVLIPHHLPIGRYPDRDRLGTPTWVANFLTGARFHLTITSLDTDAHPTTAEGMRVIESSHTELVLTHDQIRTLGLSPEQHYRIVGSLVDDNERLVSWPALEALQVPVRWLHPLNDPRAEMNSYRDADRFPYM